GRRVVAVPDKAQFGIAEQRQLRSAGPGAIAQVTPERLGQRLNRMIIEGGQLDHGLFGGVHQSELLGSGTHIIAPCTVSIPFYLACVSDSWHAPGPRPWCPPQIVSTLAFFHGTAACPITSSGSASPRPTSTPTATVPSWCCCRARPSRTRTSTTSSMTSCCSA